MSVIDDNLSLEDLLIFEGIDYKSTAGAKGEQLNIRECQNPACDSEKWKVYANADSSLGNCFSCGETFNLFGFARFMLQKRGGNPTNRDVGLYLNAIKTKLGYRPKERRVAVEVGVNDQTVELPFSAALPYENGNHPYLEARGISGEWAKRYHLRFSSFGSHKYRDDKGALQEQSFASRIVIPVFNLDGELVTFQGRDTTGVSSVRYKFAGGLPGTARYLYNGHVALAHRAKEVCMGEGAFDVIKAQIALSQYEDTKGVVMVGSWGKHLSKSSEGDDQIQAFQRLRKAGLERVTIMYDGEPEAYEEALAAAAMLLKIGLQVRIATLPAKLDPGDADARVIHDAYIGAAEYTRLTALRLKMRNPYFNA